MEDSIVTTQHATDEAGIRHQIDKLVEALRATDLEAVKSIYAPEMVSFDVGPPLQVVGVEAKAKNWTEVFTAFQHPIDYEIRNLSITVDGDLAVAHSINRLNGTLKNGNRSSFWVRATFCWQRIDGEWLVAHDHASVPLDVATGRGVVDLEP
jgi:uncharacterized protein (TIGR02246 family)